MGGENTESRQDHNFLGYFYPHGVMTQHEMSRVQDHSNEIKKIYTEKHNQDLQVDVEK